MPMDINTINQQVMKAGFKPLTPAQVARMSDRDIKQYLKTGKTAMKANRRNFRSMSRAARKNAKAESSERLKEVKIKHDTIRTGIVNATTLGSEVVASATAKQLTSSAGTERVNQAISQNINGGQTEVDSNMTEKGLVSKHRSYDGRDEE